MGDMGEGWDVYKKARQEKKRSNAKFSADLLEEKGVPFDTANGIHLIIDYNGTIVDFWPTTGKFIFRKSHFAGRGVRNLLKKLGLK